MTIAHQINELWLIKESSHPITVDLRTWENFELFWTSSARNVTTQEKGYECHHLSSEDAWNKQTHPPVLPFELCPTSAQSQRINWGGSQGIHDKAWLRRIVVDASTRLAQLLEKCTDSHVTANTTYPGTYPMAFDVWKLKPRKRLASTLLFYYKDL